MSIFRRTLRGVDNQDIYWGAHGLELQAELFLDCDKQRRNVGGGIADTGAEWIGRKLKVDIEWTGQSSPIEDDSSR